ncbi:MAG: hypothetical protein AVO38_08140 [delta proteobacterium ML8_D]|nr:MAG: hypothetical protein AVO38_08140 [delta proteobacterium ML8_D]
MEQGQDITRIKEIIKRCKWWLILPFVSIVILSGIICLILPNTYKSTATILIQSQQIPSTMVSSTVTGYAEQRINTITQEVMSRSRILDLIKKYDLLPNKREKLTTEELVDRIRTRIVLEPINAEINKETQSRPVLLTIAFTLSYSDEDPKKAQLVTNEISSYYLEKNIESREKYALETTKFLEEQLKEVKSSMDSLDTELAEYRKKHLEKLPEFTNLNMQKVEKLNSDISNINMQIRLMEEQKAALKNRLASLDPYSDTTDRILSPKQRLQQARLERTQLLSKYSNKHPLILSKNREISLLEEQVGDGDNIGQLRLHLDELELKLADLRSRYSENHPSVKTAEKELNEVKEEIASLDANAQGNSEITTDATSPSYITLKSDMDKITMSVSSLKTEKDRLETQMEEVYAKLHAMPEIAKKYNELDTDYQNTKAYYQVLQQKLLTAKVSQGMEEAQLGETFKIIEPAFLPEKPDKPNRLAIILIGIVMGMGCSVGAASLREYSNKSVRDIEIMERLTGVPVLSIIPSIVTSEDEDRQKKRTIIWTGTAIGGIALALLLFHFFVMDIYFLYAKLVRLVQSRFPIG